MTRGTSVEVMVHIYPWLAVLQNQRTGSDP
jgi:hypothetical protein